MADQDLSLAAMDLSLAVVDDVIKKAANGKDKSEDVRYSTTVFICIVIYDFE
jgi:hypothetical protein